MTNKRSFSLCSLPKAISALAALAAAALLGLAPAARAGVPDWLKAVAHDQLPAYPKETVAAVLYDEQVTTVKDSGEIETLYRRAYKILRPEGRSYGLVVVPFSNDTRLTYLKAWSLPANGKEYEVKEKDAAETSLYSDELYADLKHKILEIPAADPGNVVGYEFIQKRRPFILQDDWSFQHKIPVYRARFTLQLPPSWEYDVHWVNYTPREPQNSGQNQFTWQVDNVAPITIEPEMPPFHTVAGWLAVNFYARAGSEVNKAHASWRDVGLWYQQLADPSRTPTPEIKQKVSELTANAPSTLDKMKALTSFLQREIRYVAIEIGIGGFQPHAAGATFAYRYGDCKDKAALLSTMLREIGVDSYFVLIHTDRGIVIPDFPALTFNHAILAIRLPDGVSSDALHGIVNHPKLGRLLFFDPTNPYVPLGYLPWYLQDNYGLLVTPDGGELVKLPLFSSATNRLLRTAKFTLTSNGTLTGEVQEVRSGGPATSERAQLLRTETSDRHKALEDFLGGFLSGFTLTSASVGNLEKYDDNLTLHYEFAMDNYAKLAGNLLLLRPRVIGEKASDLLEIRERKYPVQFNEATLQSDSFDIALPAGYVVDDLPEPVRVVSDFGEYRSQIEVKNNVLHYSRTYEIKSVIVPTQKLNDLKQFYRQIAADERASAVLRRAN
jgi:hypothetical protein